MIYTETSGPIDIDTYRQHAQLYGDLLLQLSDDLHSLGDVAPDGLPVRSAQRDAESAVRIAASVVLDLVQRIDDARGAGDSRAERAQSRNDKMIGAN